MPVHDALCDGEAEAITAGSPGPGVIGAVKPFKQVGQMLRRVDVDCLRLAAGKDGRAE